MSKVSSLPKQPYDHIDSNQLSEQLCATPAWKQEVNQRLAAHRTRRGGVREDAQPQIEESPRAASKRAAEAAARVAARYAKAPSYSEVLAGEARAVVHAAGVAAEAARSAQKAAQAVLAGLESGFESSLESGAPNTLWDQPAAYAQPAPAATDGQRAPARWQDEPPAPAKTRGQAASQQNPRTGNAGAGNAEAGNAGTGNRPVAQSGAQPRWEEALPAHTPPPSPGRDVWSEMRLHPAADSAASPPRSHQPDTRQNCGSAGRAAEDAELFAYNTIDQDDFALDPLGSATVEPVQAIPANLIEFPRELVATRKARPRLVEGPFYDPAQESPQLSIFEVDPDQLAPPILLSDTGRDAVAPPEWASIELDHHQPVHPPYDALSAAYSQHSFVHELTLEAAANAVEQGNAYAPSVETEARANPVPRPAFTNSVEPTRYDRLAEARDADRTPAPAAELIIAPLSDRILAAVVDGALVTLAFLAAAVVVIASTNHPPTGRIGLLAGVCGLLLFGLLYQFLFFSYAEEGTPGMRYARVALCTFSDDNPTREQIRMRIPALLVAALPAGLGLLWALFDGDHLAWHDRLTRTYQRKY